MPTFTPTPATSPKPTWSAAFNNSSSTCASNSGLKASKTTAAISFSTTVSAVTIFP